jgi:hypothetical protein
MALKGWRVEWKTSFRDYEGVVVEYISDNVLVWELNDLSTYEWNPSLKAFKRWNPALKEFVSYHRKQLSEIRSKLKESDICRKVIQHLESLDESQGGMKNAKKLALEIENRRLQSAIMEEMEEEKTTEGNGKPDVSKSVDFNLPVDAMKKLLLKKQNSEESENYENEEFDQEDEEEEDDEDDDDENTKETSDNDEDESDDDEEDDESDDDQDYDSKKIDIKIMILHTKQSRGFYIQLTHDGLQKMKRSLEEDYGNDLHLFYRDDDGDIVSILSLDDLLYSYRCERKLIKNKKDLLKIKLKLFLEKIEMLKVSLPHFPSHHYLAEGKVNDNNSNEYQPGSGTSSEEKTNRNFQNPYYPRTGGGVGGIFDDSQEIFSSPEKSLIVEGKEEKNTPINKTGIFDMIWKKGEVLGIGSFGKVFSGINVSSGMKMAIKEVYVLKSKNSKQQVKAFQREVGILGKLDHPNIIKYLGTEYSENTLRIFLELANEGSLKDSLREFGKKNCFFIYLVMTQLLLSCHFMTTSFCLCFVDRCLS